ncbi:SulP family inorganic anion transporter [Caenimonas soli]|uniref:SulP family inorganic anion transporter n=1 Tax=Caenimonas soli TaxID=2735555 RepID=UPI0015526496|nr:solute carrier family 23 protein [Caenimonas soli]NPC59113.1 SulP family inorganic anion transporter [Caenimonas soli]
MRWLPIWRQPGVIRADLLAGLTGAVVVLPQGVAFATLAGMPPQYGLYAAMVPCVVAALFGSSRLMVTGPANAISLTTMALIAPLAATGSAEYVQLVLTLTFLVGVAQLGLGFARVGKWVEHVPHSVIAGFTAGAAVLIVNSQVGTLLGLVLPRGLSVMGSARGVWQHLGEVRSLPVLSALVTISIVFIVQRRNLKIPSMLMAVVGGSLFTWAVASLPGFDHPATVQALPGPLPPFSPPDISIETVRTLAAATLVMTLLGLTEAMAIGKAVARRSGDIFDGNQELIGQGLANFVGSFFSSYPASGSFNRSGVNVAAGARTPLAAICAAIFLVIILLFVSPLAKYLPLAVIAGLLCVVAASLFNVKELKHLWLDVPHERVALVLTFAATVTVSLEWAILIGLLTAWLCKRFLQPKS